MTSLANLIQTFQSGTLSHDAFFAQIDQTLAIDHANCTRLREVLDETQTKDPLPDDVYAEVIRHIAHFAEPDSTYGDETRVKIAPAPPPARQAPPVIGHEQERVKGIGDTLNGRFVLEECLGVGGMGTVYKALDLRKLEASDRKPYIAIKILNVQFRGQPTSLIALQREARKAQTLTHRNIVTVYDFDRDGPLVYITMEYLSGSPLSKVLRAPGFTGLPYDKARPIIAGIGNALAYAHERGFVHCDFKPANVFLTDDGEVKVIDFGIARALRRSDEETDATVFDPATLGGITPAYASPEMFEHREPDPRDDVYAVGCVTYELLTGHHPFNRASATQARSEKRKPERPANLDRRQWRTLSASLSFDRASRTPSVERFLEGMGADKRAPPRRPHASRTAIIGVGAASATLIVIAALWYGSRQWSGSSPGLTAAQPQALSLPTVMPVLADLPCSALSASVQGAVVQVSGYLGERVGVARLRDALNAVPGVKALNLDVREISDSYCDVLTAFGPYWVATHQAASPASGASIRTQAPNGQLTEGSPLVLNITTPAYDSYANVDYYVLDGNVAHIVPSSREKDNQTPPNYSATIGGMGEWVITKPLGSELIVLLITPSPLFDALRPDIEPRKAYFSAVSARLKQITAQYGANRIAVDFALITTRAPQH